MRAYFFRRLLILIPTLFLVTLLIFFLIRLMPGDIVDSLQGQSIDVKLDRATIERKLGLDAPAIILYGRWMGLTPQADGSFSGILQGDLGISWWQGTPVVQLLAARWMVTLELGILGLIIAQLIALPIGVYSALRQDTWGDYIGRSFAILCISVPYFWVGTLVIVFPSIWWNYMPPLMLIPFTEDIIGNLRMFIVPALVLGMALGGMIMRMTRTMVLVVLRQDYIRTAWAKGLSERIVILRHALKNAAIPVITLIGLQVPFVIGGTVIIEKIFSLPGMGRLILDATLFRDQPLISGIILLFSVVLMLINLLVDLTYAYLDPRIRYR
jgi:peptide/nickel transport system permease protein